MAKHKPNQIWHTHLDAKKHGCYGVVKTTNTKQISIGISDGNIVNSFPNIPRPVARLLAKRIIQCLRHTA